MGDISSELQSTVFGQEKAMKQLAGAVARSMAGFSDPNRPEMTAMLIGGTGVGKTEAGKALAKHLYPRDWEERFLRVDCTQLQGEASLGRLKGSEPGYIGSGDNNLLITPEFLKKGGVIVFDEIEKAHPAVWRWLLPVMEEGQQTVLAPSSGSWHADLVPLNFSNTYIIMTANVGAEALHRARAGNQGMGFHKFGEKPDMDKIGIGELKKHFKDMPEFLGRIDATVCFNDLERPQLERIFNKFMDEINQDQRYGHNFLAVTTELRNFVLDHAETGEYGAREIRHKIDEYIVTKASEIKVSGVLPDMAPLIGDLEGDEVIFWTSDVEKSVTLTPEQIDAVDWIVNGGPSALDEIDEDLPIENQRDAGSYIGNREVSKPTEKNTGNEDIKKPKGKYSITLTFEDGTTETVNGLDENISDLVLYGLGEDPTWNGKKVKSAHSALDEQKKPKPLSFVIPTDGVIFESMDLAINIHAGGHEYSQIIEGMPIIKTS